jgi:hypothetical protein
MQNMKLLCMLVTALSAVLAAPAVQAMAPADLDQLAHDALLQATGRDLPVHVVSDVGTCLATPGLPAPAHHEVIACASVGSGSPTELLQAPPRIVTQPGGPAGIVIIIIVWGPVIVVIVIL